jgi:hypothetical protein
VKDDIGDQGLKSLDLMRSLTNILLPPSPAGVFLSIKLGKVSSSFECKGRASYLP